jgi:hypothetical protein
VATFGVFRGVQLPRGRSQGETERNSMNRISAQGKCLLRSTMSHHNRLLPFAPRLVAGAILIAVTAMPVAAFAQDEEPSEAKPAWDLARPCENVQHPYEADLCQQWRAAQAAEQTADAAKKNAAAAEHTAKLTGILTLVGAIAAGLLLVMFIPLIAAASAARKAARAAAPAPQPSRREDEVRAYVDVDKLEFIETPESEGVVKVKVIFRNSGQTPAFETRSATKVDIKDVSDEADVPVMPLPDRAANSARPRLGRDATTTDIVECSSTPSLADRVMNGEATIVVWGWAEYTDVFDVKRKTKFQYLCNAETLDTGQIFKPVIRGDEGA